MEISVVLIIIAVIVGAVSSGSNLMRQANGQRVFADFIVGWRSAFGAYTSRVHAVPGDNIASPTNRISGPAGAAQLCNDASNPALTNAFLAVGVALPSGRGVGLEDRFIYQDSRGNPHELRACLQTVDWSVPGTSVGSFIVVQRHVLQLTGLTTELAMQLDATVDGLADARFGAMRSDALRNSLSPQAGSWPALAGDPDSSVAEVAASMLIN